MSLYRRPGSPYWWSKLYAGGRVYRFSTGTRTKIPALRKEREEANRLERAFKAGSVRSLATLAAQFLEHIEAGNRAEATRLKIQDYISREILPFFGATRDAATMTAKDLEDYKAHRMRKVSASTVAKELSALRRMMRFAGDVLKLFPPGETPSTRNPMMPKYKPSWRLLSKAELARLIAPLKAQDRKGKEALPFFLLVMNTGMRSGEASALMTEWIDTKAREIHLPASATKTRTARTVPLNKSALAALAMVKRPNPVGRVFRYSTHYGAWHIAVHAAGLAKPGTIPGKTSGIRPHDLRHSYGSLLHATGASMPEVRDILGHVTLTMANLYAHTFTKHLHRAVRATEVGRVPSVPKNVPLLKSPKARKVTNGHIDNPRRRRVSATGK